MDFNTDGMLITEKSRFCHDTKLNCINLLFIFFTQILHYNGVIYARDMVLIILLLYGYNMYIVQVEERCNLLAYRGVHTKEGKRIMQQA